MRVFWLGPAHVEVNGAKLHFETRKASALLAYLSLNSKANPREILAALFWPEDDQTHALASLRRALGSLMRCLPPGVLEVDRESIRWNEDYPAEIDVMDFRAALAEVRAHSHAEGMPCKDCMEKLECLVKLYRGDFLEGLNLPDCTQFDEWQYFLRDELKKEYAWVLERLASSHAGLGDYEQAAALARRWVSLDRLDTGAQLALVGVYARSGQRRLALRQYEEFAHLWEDELGLALDEEYHRSFEDLIQQASSIEEAGKKPPLALPAGRNILKTKLYVPKVRNERVTRSRLLEQLDQVTSYAFTLLSAPAGFGKTSLLAEWASRTDCPVAWLSLDKNDNQTGRFLSYFVAAFQERDNTIGSEAVQLVRAAQQAPPEMVLTSLINDLDTIARVIVLVLDDYQFISNQAVHEAVAFFLEHCPDTFHLVIATRSDPPLPLALLRARGQTVELRAADLRFTRPETAQFLNDVMGLQMDAGLVAALEERTEGWIAGLQMAALSMRDREDVLGFIEGFSGTNRHILDYLLEEVLAREPEEVQAFLLQTAVLSRLAGSLCDAVTGVSGGQEMLETLERRNLFVVPLDDERHWYRYHHLFADLLRARLHQAKPALVPHLHIRASGWLEQKGFITEAINQLFAASEMDKAADLIERYGPARLADSNPSVLQMSDNLPRELLLARPKLGIYLAWLFIIQSHIDKAVPLLKDLEQQLTDADSGNGLRWLQSIIATALGFLSPLPGDSGFYPLPDYELLDEIPAEELNLRNAVDYLYGMALARRGEILRAVEVSIKCIQREKQPPGSLAIPTLAPFLSRVYLMLGRLHAAASLCREYLDPIRERGIQFIYTAGSMQIDLGEVLYEWNCLEEAEQHIRDGLKTAAPWQNIMTDSFGWIALTRVLQAKEDYAGAMQIVEKFEKRMQRHFRTPREFDEDLQTLRVRTQLASGDLQNPSHWADQVHLSEDFLLHKENYRLTLARIRLAQGRYAEVEKLLAGVEPLMAAGSRVTKKLESNLLLATAVAEQQRLPEALGLIEDCLALAEPEGYLRVFLDVGEPARKLLSAYLSSNTPAHKLYAQKVLDTFLPIRASDHQPVGLVEPLSGRELEVLHLMALGRTNQDIARQLVVAPGTVKAHAASIYRKLDVANRTEAVARARQLDILP